ncbi:MAG: Ig-like domain-containing protein [Lachnospiraceae bacterium]|nr:Ig-like domain-containing protein [Lachnospiraceae bacterium]
MKKIMKLCSIVVILSLFLNLYTPVQAEEGEQAIQGENITLSMTVQQTEETPEVGDAVTVKIQADKDFLSRGAGMTIYYDENVLKPDLEKSSAAEPFSISNPQTIQGKTALRISFKPGTEEISFTAAQSLAEISFEALAAAEESAVSMPAAYTYDKLLTRTSVTRSEPVKVTVKQDETQETIPVTGITLDQAELTLEEGESADLEVSITPGNASDKEIIWKSSDETIAAVSEGAVKAIREGSAVITASTKDGKFSASCSVTVKIPNAGYQVTMPADIIALKDDTVQIPVTVSHKEAKDYNAFDMTFTYDKNVLELDTTPVLGVTVTAGEDTVHVLGYGAKRESGTSPFTLKFKVIADSNTKIQLTQAKVDHSANAVIKNAAQAAITDDTTAVIVSGYYVTLPEGFAGEGIAKLKTDYSFFAPDDYFDYTVKVTVGGNEIQPVKNADGSYTIPAEQIKGEIVVTADKAGKIFPVTLGEDMTGKAQAQHGTDYTAALNADEKYIYTVTATVGGEEYTGFAVTEGTKENEKIYTVPGVDITGDIVFTVEKTEKIIEYAVTFSGSGAGAALGNAASIEEGKTYTLTLMKENGYLYQVFCTAGDLEKTVISPDKKGNYVVENVTADLEFIIEKTLDIDVSLYEYVNLDEKTIFLVLVETKPENGKVYTYDGNAMYYSKSYDAWVRLAVFSQDYDPAAVKAKIAVSDGVKQVIEKPDYDVNNTGLVDINDAQLVYDMYNGKYENFDKISMMKFLNADVNMDKKVSVKDAAGVVANIR